MNRCRTCVFWKQPDAGDLVADDVIAPYDFKNRRPIQNLFEVRLCRSPKNNYDEKLVETDTEIYILDRGSLGAVLATSENFGCVNHSTGEDSRGQVV